ncbi:MAG: hypothetical protein M0P71_17820 [Melioribacteraceae bacterium]|nr:hypothetical protein [Melioribacteraceae bacterium]
METDKQIINKIQKIRARNNIAWMNLLQIAFKYAPEESRIIFKDICHNDSEINKLSKELAK